MAKHTQQSAILQELVEHHQLVQGDPCLTCACELYRTTMYQWASQCDSDEKVRLVVSAKSGQILGRRVINRREE